MLSTGSFEGRARFGFGHQYGKQGSKLPDSYICDRCTQPGHHIKDCPENGNTYFDPCKNRGVPKQHIWKKQLNINDDFKRNAGNVVKSLLKNNEIYSLEEEADEA